MSQRVTMHHPGVGEIQVSLAAVRVHEKKGWVQIEGTRRVSVPAADGSILTTGTVFPPETFDDDEPDSSADTASEPGAPATTTQRAKRTNTQES